LSPQQLQKDYATGVVSKRPLIFSDYCGVLGDDRVSAAPLAEITTQGVIVRHRRLESELPDICQLQQSYQRQHFMNWLFHTAPVGWMDRLHIVLVGLVIYLVIGAEKRWRLRRETNGTARPDPPPAEQSG
jgi:hypothetical protein